MKRITWFCAVVILGGQAIYAAQSGQELFSQHCIACHGDDATGTDMGPSLAGTRRLRTRSIDQLRTIISAGLPSSGMPAFHLPAEQIDALASFVRALNSTAAEASVEGMPASGEKFFFGEGHCSECHMVRGRGKAVGPDLSNVAHEMTLGELKQVLRNPAARLTPGYEMVSVRLRDGKTLSGFARGRTNFDLQLQGTDGGFHMIKDFEIAEIHPEKGTIMKPVSATPALMGDLVAYLASLRGVPVGVTAVTGIHATPDFDRILNPHPGDWLSYNGTLDGNRYSKLTTVNQANVKDLAIKWIFPIDHFGLEVTPIVVDGMMYITGPNQAIALDALTGRQIWKYSRPRTAGLIGDASLGTNRGVAILGDNVFMTTDNAHLLAINRITGSLVWDVYMPEEAQHYGSTVAPLVVKDMIIAGVSGGDRGIRGFLASYKATTGERVWRHWTIPKKGEPGSETWQGKEPLEGGGATWLTGAYDAAADTLFWPTGNPYPDSDDRERGGDNLYSNCILALNPDTGAMKWYYQFTPHDVHDWDATEPPVLVDTKYQGSERKLLLHADRNGFFYVLDRVDGKVLLAKAFAKRNTWTKAIGADGRPEPSSDTSPFDCPSDAANWDSATFSPVTRLFYVLTLEQCRIRRTGNWKAAEQTLEPPQKLLRAINIDTGAIAWEIPFAGTVVPKTWPGVLGTAGGLLFYSDPNGTFAAADERTGKTLWHFATNVLMKASPMTYAVDGKQFIATVAGPAIVAFGLPER